MSVAPPRIDNTRAYIKRLRSEFSCPLSHELLQDPVRIVNQPEQHVFERSWIKKWLERRWTNPMTRADVRPEGENIQNADTLLVDANDVKDQLEQLKADVDAYLRTYYSGYQYTAADKERLRRLMDFESDLHGAGVFKKWWEFVQRVWDWTWNLFQDDESTRDMNERLRGQRELLDEDQCVDMFKETIREINNERGRSAFTRAACGFMKWFWRLFRLVLAPVATFAVGSLSLLVFVGKGFLKWLGDKIAFVWKGVGAPIQGRD